MSEEMVMQTPDSPAGALDGSGAAGAIVDMVRDVVEPESYAQDVNYEGVQEVDGGEYDFDPYDLLGVEQPDSTNYEQHEPGPVPYDRFREVNEKARQYNDQLSRWGDVIQEFERQGFASAADLQAAIAAQQAQAQEQAIVDRYKQLEQQDLLDPTTSQLQMQAELERFRYQQAMHQVSQYMVDQQKQQALAQFPLAQRNQALVDSLVQRGLEPIDAAQIVHDQVHQLTRALVPELVDRLNQGRTAPTPTGQRQSARPVVNNAQQPQVPGMRSSLSQLLGIGRNKQSI